MSTAVPDRSFVATVLLQLAGEGHLSLDDTVDTWLPGLVRGHGNDGRRVTLRQLLQHTSGLPDYIGDVVPDLSAAGYRANRWTTYTSRQRVALAMKHQPISHPVPAGSTPTPTTFSWAWSSRLSRVTPGSTRCGPGFFVRCGSLAPSPPATHHYLPGPHARDYQQFEPGGALTDTTVAYLPLGQGLAEGVEVTVETQGSAGFSKLDPAVIARADAVIWAHDVEVREKARFRGKPLVDVGVKAGINRPAELIAEARRKAESGEIAAVPQGGDGPADGADGGSGADSAHFGVRLRTYLMSGVSYMVPFVAAGGLLIALSFAIGGYEIADAKSVADHFVWGQADSWAALLNQIGSAAFGFLVPVLAGYIAYGMADRPALVPGFVGGAIALTVDAGFLGGLVAGLLAGAVVMAIQRVPVHATLRGIMPVLVIPLIASAVVGFLMFIVVGKPIAALQSALTDWLNGLSGSNAVILGVVLGLMMCFDMGGPLNKVAYAFAVGGLADPTDGSLKVMAAVMAAGMVPPLAMALATTVRKKLFTKTERENGRAAWVLGASFITEGAIPFAAADPLRVIPSVMAGGAVTGALSMAFGCTLRAPHGGIFVVPLIGEPFLYLLAIAAGTLVATALVVLLKGARRTVPVLADEAGATAADARVGATA
ncbi:hypothetical protein SCYAM73S_05224 [Streptomyces cyaneofuscatus]